MEEFRLAVIDFPSPHSERDSSIEAQYKEIEQKILEDTNKMASMNMFNADTNTTSLNSGKKSKKKKKKKKKKKEKLQLFIETCLYSNDSEAIFTNARRRIRRILRTNQSGPLLLERRLKLYEWVFSSKEDVLVTSLVTKFEQASVSS